MASTVHGLNFYLLPQNYTYSMYNNNNNYYYVAHISNAQGQCGLKASSQPPMNLAVSTAGLGYSKSQTKISVEGHKMHFNKF